MMYRCYVCRTLHHSRAYLIRHLKLSHGLYPGKKLNLLCAQDGCSLEFKSYCGFRQHKLFHSDTSDTELPSCSDEISDSTVITSVGMPALPMSGPNSSSSFGVLRTHEDLSNRLFCVKTNVCFCYCKVAGNCGFKQCYFICCRKYGRMFK